MFFDQKKCLYIVWLIAVFDLHSMGYMGESWSNRIMWGMSDSERAEISPIIQAMSRRQKKFLGKATYNIRYQMNLVREFDIAKFLLDIPEDKRRSFMQFCKSIHKEWCFWVRDKVSVSDVLSPILAVPRAQRRAFIALGKSLLAPGMPAFDRGDVIKAFLKIPEEDREEVARYSKQFFADQMTPDTKVDIIKVLTGIPTEDRSNVVNYAKGIFLGKVSGWSRSQILKIISDIPREKRPVFMERVKSLFPDHVSDFGVHAIIGSIYEVPESEQEEIVGYMKDLNLKGAYRYDFITKEILKIPSPQRASIVGYVKSLEPKSNCVVENLIPAVCGVPESEREDVVCHVRNLSVEGDGVWPSMIESMAKIPRDQRIPIIRQVRSVSRYSWDVDKLIPDIYAIPQRDRESVVGCLSSLFQNTQKVSHIKWLISCIRHSSLSPEGIVETISPLLSGKEDGRFIGFLIKDVESQVSIEGFESFIKSIKLLFKEGSDSSEDKLCFMPLFARLITMRERESVSRQVQTFTLPPYNYKSLNSLLIFLATPAGLRGEIYEILRSLHKDQFDTYCYIIKSLFFRAVTHGYNQFTAASRLPEVRQFTAASRRNIYSVNDSQMSRFATTFLRRYYEAQADQERALDFTRILIEARDHVTQQIAGYQGGVFHNGLAFEIHNAVKIPISYHEETRPAFAVVAQILKEQGVQKMPLSQCIEEMKSIPGLENLESVKGALEKAYYAPSQQDLIYVDAITPLLGSVWPYMKTLPESVQRDWLNLVVAESFTAYGSDGGLSCSKGIQERLTVTGFLPLLEGVDPRLIALSSFTATLASLEGDSILEQGFTRLSREQYANILTLPHLTEKTVKSLFSQAVESYARSREDFHVEGLDLVSDFINNPFLQSKIDSLVELYTTPEYGKLKSLKGISRKKLEEMDAEEEAISCIKRIGA